MAAEDLMHGNAHSGWHALLRERYARLSTSLSAAALRETPSISYRSFLARISSMTGCLGRCGSAPSNSEASDEDDEDADEQLKSEPSLKAG